MNALETFKQFLMDKRCLESYTHYLDISDYYPKDEYIHVYLFVVGAFDWELTKEGDFFWSIKDDEWKRIAKNYDRSIKYTLTQVLEYLNTETESLWTD